MTSLENTTVINKLSDTGFVSFDSCKLFYPLHSCSNVCGFIVVCMVAILVNTGIHGLATWDKQKKLPLITNPSVNSKQLQLIVMSWIVNNTINTGNLVPEKALKPTKMYTYNFTKIDTSNLKNVGISQNCEPAIAFGNQLTDGACIINPRHA